MNNSGNSFKHINEYLLSSPPKKRWWNKLWLWLKNIFAKKVQTIYIVDTEEFEIASKKRKIYET